MVLVVATPCLVPLLQLVEAGVAAQQGKMVVRVEVLLTSRQGLERVYLVKVLLVEETLVLMLRAVVVVVLTPQVLVH